MEYQRRQMQQEQHQRETEKQIYTYVADWVIYALGFSWRETSDFRLAIGSLKEDLANEIKIIKLSDNADEDFTCVSTFSHNFPATKLLWMPNKSASHPDLLATSSDFLRIWKVDDERNTVSLESELKDNSQSFSAPLTSFDWNQKDVSILGVCSLDTTCSIWDIGKESIKAQLIAHDKEVFDIGFQDVNVFATVGADGSMRMFDLRSLEHSTILYETAQNGMEGKPLLRLGWNNQDSSYIATFEPDSNKVIILDVRVPIIPV
jgi:WD repeat-containing protein 68